MPSRSLGEGSRITSEYANSLILGQFSELEQEALVVADMAYVEKKEWHGENEEHIYSASYVSPAGNRSLESLSIRHSSKMYLNSIRPGLAPYELYDRVFDYGYKLTDEVQVVCSGLHQYFKKGAAIRRYYEVSAHLTMEDVSEEIGIVAVNGTVVPGLPRKGDFLSLADSMNTLDRNDVKRVKQAVAWLLAT